MIPRLNPPLSRHIELVKLQAQQSQRSSHNQRTYFQATGGKVVQKIFSQRR
jgi:hypothetical protein